METMGNPSAGMRVCPNCYVLQWEEDGKTETRYPQTLPDQVN
jgi:hypothetical protein